MSFTLALVAAAVAISAGLLASRRGRREADEPDGEPTEAAEALDATRGDAEPAPPFASLPLSLGDVVSVDREERWLAGALVLRDAGRVVAALFVAPEGAQLRAVAAFAPPDRSLAWLAPAHVDSPEEPPATIEIGGRLLRRRRRLPVAIERLGQGAPRVGDVGVFAIYDGGGRDVAVVITSGATVSSWVGTRHDEGEWDRLGAGGAD